MTSSQWKSWLSWSGVNASGRTIDGWFAILRRRGASDADDGVRPAVDADLLADDVGSALKRCRPRTGCAG